LRTSLLCIPLLNSIPILLPSIQALSGLEQAWKASPDKARRRVANIAGTVLFKSSCDFTGFKSSCDSNVKEFRAEIQQKYSVIRGCRSPHLVPPVIPRFRKGPLHFLLYWDDAGGYNCSQCRA